MITPVGNKLIFAIIPARAVSQLKGVTSIDSFTFGKQNLRPAIVELFKRQEIEIKDIYLDNPARVRLMGMMPSFESLVAEGKTIEEIFFSKLGLSLFSSDSESGAQALYVLGDKANIKLITNAPRKPQTILPENIDISDKPSIINRKASNNAMTAASRKPKIKLPEMIKISKKLRIMKGEVTVDLFKRVMQGCKFTGYDASSLRTMLNNPSVLYDPSGTKDSMIYVSLLDARRFAKRLSNLTGRKFRVQTEDEWLKARDQLSGDNFTWTETLNTPFSSPVSEKFYVLRQLDNFDDSRYLQSDIRYEYTAIRLVEELPAGKQEK